MTTYRKAGLIGRFFGNAKGSTATIFALSIVPMLLAVGGAVDYSRYYDATQSLQTALDAAVLAGASAGSSTTVAAKTFAAWNVGYDGTVGTPSFCVGNSSCDGTTTLFSGSVSGKLNMYVLALGGYTQISVNAKATAQKATAASTGSSSGCLWLTSTSSGLTANSGGSINGGSSTTPTCEIDVAATSSGSSSLNSGAKIITSKLCIAATQINNNGGTVNNGSSTTSTLSLGCTVTNFLSTITSSQKTSLSTAPSTSCNYSSTSYDSSSVTLNPGVYCGTINFNSGVKTVTLNPGVYVLKSAVFNLDTDVNVTGTGVTFYFVDGNSYIQLNSRSTTTLSAPTTSNCGTYVGINSCTYVGILMFEPSSGTTGSSLSSNSWSLSDNGTQNWTGIVYLPSRPTNSNSNSVVKMSGPLVLNNLSLNGQIQLTSSSSSSSSSGTIVRLVK